jgi:hypothetical protein
MRRWNHGIFQPASWIQDRDTVQFEKNQCGSKRGSFVASDKRVILAQVIGVGSGHCIVFSMQPLACKRRLWLGEGGLDQR